jgi:hypothetical protein
MQKSVIIAKIYNKILIKIIFHYFLTKHISGTNFSYPSPKMLNGPLVTMARPRFVDAGTASSYAGHQ